MKICNKCKKSKEEKEFPKRGDHSGKPGPYCRKCKREYDREYWKKVKKRYRPIKKEFERERKTRNAQYIWDYLSIHPCIDCGETDPVVLEFDHVKGKNANISDLNRHPASIDKINKEIEKCVVRCANCHRRKTAKEFNWYKHIKK